MSRVIHFEFPADDPAKVNAFFKATFGWEFQKWGDQDYYLTTGGDDKQPGIGGAILKRTNPEHRVTTTIGVESIDEAVKTIEANGGKIVVPKEPVETMGFIAYFTDPEGTMHGLWESV